MPSRRRPPAPLADPEIRETLAYLRGRHRARRRAPVPAPPTPAAPPATAVGPRRVDVIHLADYRARRAALEAAQ